MKHLFYTYFIVPNVLINYTNNQTLKFNGESATLIKTIVNNYEFFNLRKM